MMMMISPYFSRSQLIGSLRSWTQRQRKRHECRIFNEQKQ